MNHYQVQKIILEKLTYAQQYIDKLKIQLATIIMMKSKKIGVISKDLQQKCLKQFKKQRKEDFRCKFCDKVFSEGRQLGGHVSRAHKGVAIKENLSEESFKSFGLRKKGPIKRLREQRKARRQVSSVSISSEKSENIMFQYEKKEDIYLPEYQ